MAVVQDKEVVCLKKLVVEFDEGETLLSFQPYSVRLHTDHLVHFEVLPDVPKEVDVVEVAAPVGIVDVHAGFPVEIQESLHLAKHSSAVRVDILDRQHLAHLGLPAWVADKRRGSANEADSLMPVALEVRHSHDRNEAADVQAVSRGIEARIECDPFGRKELPERFFV